MQRDKANKEIREAISQGSERRDSALLISQRAEKHIQNYMNYLKHRNIRSRETYRVTVQAFLDWCCEQQIDFLSVKEIQLDRWRGDELKKGLSHGTINNKTFRLKTFYRFLIRQNLIFTSPLEDFKALRVGKCLPRNILKVDEMEQLLSRFAILSSRDVMLLCLMEILYGSALRISEALSLKLQDIDFADQNILITEHKKDRQRKVPVSHTALKSIGNYDRSVRCDLLSPMELAAGYLFPQQGSTTIRCTLNRRLERECKRLGLNVITSHSFRHAAATHMLKNGAGIRQVQTFLGHEKISSTERYTRVLKEDLRNVIDHCHPRERKTHERK